MSAQSQSKSKIKIALYWPLIKSLQTGLLLATGIAGYLSAHTAVRHSHSARPVRQPLPGHQRLDHHEHVVRPRHRRQDEAHAQTSRRLGRVEPQGSVSGRHGHFDPRRWLGGCDCAAVRFGRLCRLVLRRGRLHLWLKRRTCWSIVWGGISGAMPILRGACSP